MYVYWSGAVSDTLLVVAFRALPFLLYLWLTKHKRFSTTLVATAFYTTILVASGPHAITVLLWWLVGYGYYSLIAVVLHWMAKDIVALRRRDSAALVAIMIGAFLAIPALTFSTVAAATFLILGWELVLKGYSYVAERAGREESIGGCLFFFLVDPTLVYVQRASRSPEVTAPVRILALARMTFATCALFAGYLIVRPVGREAAAWLAHAHASTLSVALLNHGAVRFVTGYIKHSSVASLQISLMRLCGYHARERYNYPFLARSPLEFWKRWNTYVGEWARRYMYFPLALALKRRRAFKRSPLTVPVAAVVTFIGVGLYHDLYTWFSTWTTTLTLTAFFAIHGIAGVAWLAVAGRPGESEAIYRVVQRSSRPLFVTGFLLLLGAW